MDAERNGLRWRSGTAALALAVALLSAAPVPAQTNDPPRDPGEALDDLAELLDELARLIDRMPRYALPEVTEDGDIIIRRKDKQDEDERRKDVPPPVDPGDVIDL